MEQKEESKEKILQAEEERKDEPEVRRGGGYQKRRGGGNVQYVEKGSHQPKKPHEAREKPNRKQFTKMPKPCLKPQQYSQHHERVEITLETAIPVKPKKQDMIKPMDEEEYQKKYNELKEQQETIWTNYHKIYSTVKASHQTSQADGTFVKNLMEAAQKKAEVKKERHDKWKGINERFKKVKEEQELLYDQTQKYRQKMKILLNKEQLEEKLSDLQNQLYNGINNIQQEKKLIKEIEDLEKSLPFAAPLEALNKQFDSKKIEKKKTLDEMNQAWKLYEEARNDWQLVEDELQMHKQTRKDSGSIKVGEEMHLKRQEAEAEEQIIISKVAKVKELNQEFRKQWEEYYDQEKLIKDIDWMTKIQKRLKRADEQRKYEEQERRAEEEENKEIKENPFKEDLELVQLLVNYCKKLQPKKIEEAKPVEQSKDIAGIINKGEWKKDNVQILKCKKDIDNDFFSGKNKKKGKKEPQQQKAQTAEEKPESPLNHRLDVIAYFDKLKVLPPLWANQIDNTIKQLLEKKEYFIKFQDGSQPKEKQEEHKKEVGQKEEKKEEDDEKKNEEIKEDKKTEQKQRKNKQEKYEFNEDEFPSM